MMKVSCIASTVWRMPAPRQRAPERAPQHAIEVAVGIVRSGDGLLVARRPERSHAAGTWESPGGKVRSGESMESALRREVAEEVGVEFRSAVLLHRDEHD